MEEWSKRSEAEMRFQDSIGPHVHDHLRQEIRNRRPIPPRDGQVTAQPPIEVTAWIVWATDGLQLLDTTAVGWAGHDVLIHINDRRWESRGVWLHAHDVRRRD